MERTAALYLLAGCLLLAAGSGRVAGGQPKVSAVLGPLPTQQNPTSVRQSRQTCQDGWASFSVTRPMAFSIPPSSRL